MFISVCENCGEYGLPSCYTVCPTCGHKMTQLKRRPWIAHTETAPYLFVSDICASALFDNITIKEVFEYNDKRFVWTVVGPRDFFQVKRDSSDNEFRIINE